MGVESSVGITETMKQFTAIALVEESRIGLARRMVSRCALEIGLPERKQAELEILVNELGSNAIKFARGSAVLHFAAMDQDLHPAGVEIVYTDKGPGIENVEVALVDGYTTSGSLGMGLGAARRLADEFHVYTTPQTRTHRLPRLGRTTHGTVIVVRKYVDPEVIPRHGGDAWAALTRAPEGESRCGDGYLVLNGGGRVLVAIIDGLGHGEAAALAASTAVDSIGSNRDEPLDLILRRAHEDLAFTRGAVVGVGAIDRGAATLEFAGIGNTECRLIAGDRSTRLISLNGTLGSRLDRIKVFREDLPRVATLILHTDGISERWAIEHYPGLLGLDPQLLCAALIRDFNRSRDDSTILCGRLSL